MFKAGIIPNSFIIAASSCLGIMQIILGTDLIFAVAISLSIFFGLFATNVLGGLKTVTGLATAVMLFKLVGLSQLMKVILLQNSDSILTAPIETALVFMVGFFMIFLAAHLSNFRPDNFPQLPMPMSTGHFHRIGIVAFAISVVVFLSLFTIPPDSYVGRIVFGISNYLRTCFSLSTACLVAAHLKKTNGAKLLNKWALLSIAVGLTYGALKASKFAMFEPMVVVSITAIAFGYNNLKKLVFSSVVVGALGVFILYPLSQIRKNSVVAFSIGENFDSLIDFYLANMTSVSDMADAFALTIESGEESLENRNYLGFHFGLFERFALIDPADILITQTKIKGFDGYDAIFEVLNFLPNSIIGSKEAVYLGNNIGHKMEVLGEFDNITAVATTPLAHAWSVDGWVGLTILTFTSFYLIFTSAHIIGNDIMRNPWAIPILINLQHQLAESDAGTNFFYLLRILPFTLGLFYLLYHYSKPDQILRDSAYVRS